MRYTNNEEKQRLHDKINRYYVIEHPNLADAIGVLDQCSDTLICFTFSRTIANRIVAALNRMEAIYGTEIDDTEHPNPGRYSHR